MEIHGSYMRIGNLHGSIAVVNSQNGIIIILVENNAYSFFCTDYIIQLYTYSLVHRPKIIRISTTTYSLCKTHCIYFKLV